MPVDEETAILYSFPKGISFHETNSVLLLIEWEATYWLIKLLDTNLLLDKQKWGRRTSQQWRPKTSPHKSRNSGILKTRNSQGTIQVSKGIRLNN